MRQKCYFLRKKSSLFCIIVSKYALLQIHICKRVDVTFKCTQRQHNTYLDKLVLITYQHTLILRASPLKKALVYEKFIVLRARQHRLAACPIKFFFATLLVTAYSENFFFSDTYTAHRSKCTSKMEIEDYFHS